MPGGVEDQPCRGVKSALVARSTSNNLHCLPLCPCLNQYYDLPVLSLRSAVYPLMLAGAKGYRVSAGLGSLT